MKLPFRNCRGLRAYVVARHPLTRLRESPMLEQVRQQRGAAVIGIVWLNRDNQGLVRTAGVRLTLWMVS